LNRAETQNPERESDRALELPELERRLSDFWAVQSGSFRVAQAVGLLLMNGMVAADADPEYSWQRQRTVAQRYRITPAGKQFLLDNLEQADRVG
jgi:hypothetical protein